MPFRSHSEEEITDQISIDDYLIKNKEASFILKVKGESMVDVGIMPGDLVIVERGKKPKNGDIIVVYEDGEHLFEYFYSRRDQTKENIKVEAVVTGIVRSYK